MLKPVRDDSVDGYIHFSDVGRNSFGEGICYVYGATSRNTKYGKPFVTLFLRDVDGNSLSGYIFDMDSPLQSGVEVKQIQNQIVLLKWRENYIYNRGLSLMVESVKAFTNPTDEMVKKFRGTVENIDEKVASLEKFFFDVLKKTATIPWTISHSSSLQYEQGKVGGLLEHYCRMKKIIEVYDYLPVKEYRCLVATFLYYLTVHSTYIEASDRGEESIQLVTTLTSVVTKLSNALGTGIGGLEIVNMFFGYTPKDIYVRTVKEIADSVNRVNKEFQTYHTLPLSQEGDAGYGTIRRYIIEKDDKP